MSDLGLGSLVIDPRGAKAEVLRPTVKWDNDHSPSTPGEWAGTWVGSADHPQAELRRTLANGAHVVLRLSILGDIAKGGQVAASPGVMLTANKAIHLLWRELYTMQAAIDEAVDMLMLAQQETLRDVGGKLADPDAPDEAEVA